jgi:hypothetical protein
MTSETQALTKGQLNKKANWCTVTIRRVTLETLRNLAKANNRSVADILDDVARQLKDHQESEKAK